MIKIEAVVGKRRTRMEAEDRFLAAKLQKQKDDTKPKRKGDSGKKHCWAQAWGQVRADVASPRATARGAN